MRTTASHSRFEHLRFTYAGDLGAGNVNDLAGYGDIDQPATGERDSSVVADGWVTRGCRSAVNPFLGWANRRFGLDRRREPRLGVTGPASPPHDDRNPDKGLHRRDFQDQQQDEFDHAPGVVHSVLRRLRRARLGFDVEFYVVARNRRDAHVRDVWTLRTREAAAELDA